MILPYMYLKAKLQNFKNIKKFMYLFRLCLYVKRHISTELFGKTIFLLINEKNIGIRDELVNINIAEAPFISSNLV